MSAANGLWLLLESDAARARLTRAERGHVRAALAALAALETPRNSPSDIIGAALDVCERQQRQPGQDAEFWKRLAGSLRKAATIPLK